MADSLIFTESTSSQVESSPFVSKQVVYVTDTNNSVYTGGQLQFDTSSFSNCGKYCDYNNAFFEIPLIIQQTWGAGSTNLNKNAVCPFDVGFKAGFHNIFHSIQVEYNNVSVCQLVPYHNMYVSWKCLTSWSEEDVKKWGALTGFIPDSSTSHGYYFENGGGIPAGKGSFNNVNIGGNSTTTLGNNDVSNRQGGVEFFNKGFLKRQIETTAFAPVDDTVTCGGNKSDLYPADVTPTGQSTSFRQLGRNYYYRGADDSDSKYWFVIATIRLKDMHDFFDKFPLSKGSYFRFLINLNMASHTILYTAGAANDTMARIECSATTVTNGTTPLMVAGMTTTPLCTERANSFVAGGTAEVVYTISIAKSTDGLQSHPAFTQCRLYVPIYQFNPIFEEQYISLNSAKTIRYKDIYQYTVSTSGSSSGVNVQVLLSNGIPNLKGMWILPMYASTANPVNLNNTVFLPAHQSPFASEPSTCSPGIYLGDLNIQLAGINVFTQNHLYLWENFKEELQSVNAINGGLTDGMSSGLISYNDYVNNYGAVYINLARRMPSEDPVSKSVQLSCKVYTPENKAVDLFCFLEMEKSITISVLTGQKLA
jgi:hypothetical protein